MKKDARQEIYLPRSVVFDELSVGLNEFEDGEGSFLFYNPDVWTGNFRISAFKGNASYGKDAIRQELKENDSASLVKIGTWDCAYSKEMFQEEGTYYTSHLWITGTGNIAFECSFTVPKGGSTKEAEEVIATLEARKEGEKYPAELIPSAYRKSIRLMKATSG